MCIESGGEGIVDEDKDTEWKDVVLKNVKSRRNELLITIWKRINDEGSMKSMKLFWTTERIAIDVKE